MRMETPTATCAWDGAGNAKIPAARTRKRTKRAIRMILTFLAFCWAFLRLQRVAFASQATHWMKPGTAPKVASILSKACRKNSLAGDRLSVFLVERCLSDNCYDAQASRERSVGSKFFPPGTRPARKRNKR